MGDIRAVLERPHDVLCGECGLRAIEHFGRRACFRTTGQVVSEARHAALASAVERIEDARKLLLDVPAMRRWMFVNSVRRCGWCDAFSEDMGPEPLQHDEDCPLRRWLKEVGSG